MDAIKSGSSSSESSNMSEVKEVKILNPEHIELLRKHGIIAGDIGSAGGGGSARSSGDTSDMDEMEREMRMREMKMMERRMMERRMMEHAMMERSMMERGGHPMGHHMMGGHPGMMRGMMGEPVRHVPTIDFNTAIVPTDEYFHKKGLCGLVNLGNTCFMNTIIQCINNNRDLARFMITNEYKEHLIESKDEAQLVVEWNEITRGLYHRNATLNPIKFHSCIRSLARDKGYNEFTGHRQSDSHEFLQFFLESMHNAMASEVSMKIKGTPSTEFEKWAVEALTCWKRFFQNDYSPIVAMYYGQLFSMITSQEDPLYRSLSFDPFSSVSLEIPARIKTPSIYDCLDHYTHQEELVEYKQNADDKNNYKKQVRFWRLPDHFVMFFKRFNSKGQKIDIKVDFPTEGLDMSRYCLNYDRKNMVYDLYGVANHIGGMGGGHYYAFCKNIDGVWYNFNDSNIHIYKNPTDEKYKDRDVSTPAAYCLFYRRRD